jgi:hypothetical protein
MGTISGDNRKQDHGAMQDADAKYKTRYVDAADLPDDRDWLFVRCGDALYFVVKRDHCEAELDEAWAAFRAMGR